MKNFVIRSVPVLLLCTVFGKCQDILGCGGFVKSSIDINFSLVQIKLYTKFGSLKYETDCAPNNGYYMVPLYDKGEHILKIEPPAGWSFEPETVEINIDGETDMCSKGDDINFHFKGFSVTGQVLSKNSQMGPEGLTVTIKMKNKKEALQTVTTDTNGAYFFNKIMPDVYVVSVSHPMWKFEKSTASVTVANDNAAADSLVVKGYDVQGKVMSEGEAVNGVMFFLFSDSVSTKDIDGCSKSKVEQFAQDNFLCHVTSTESGIFTYPHLPPGTYWITPFYRDDHIVFDVNPDRLDFTLGHKSLVLDEFFQVEGFSVNGRVRTIAEGKGIAGASVLVNGVQQAVTAADGSYHLESVKTGSYTFEVRKEHFTFDAVTVKITPNTPQLPDIIASLLSLCGRVVIYALPEGLPAVSKRKMMLTRQDKGSDIISKSTDTFGEFCFELPPGQYNLKVALTSQEIKAGLALHPAEQIVDIIDAPVLGITFLQFQASVTGAINCMEKCQPMQVVIMPVGKEEAVGTAQITAGKSNTSVFKFKNILPGKYKVVLLHDNWCWQYKELDAEVTTQDVAGLEFFHKGYIMSCTSSHQMELNYQMQGKQKNSFTVERGLNKFCLPSPGEYELTPRSCHEFEQSMYKFNTAVPSIIVMNAVRHRVTGSISVRDNITTPLTISVKSTLEANISPLTPVRKNSHLLEFSYMGRNGEELTFMPLSNELLFYPPSKHVTIHNDCLENAAKFDGKMGVFVEGKVEPSLEGAIVSVTSKSDGEVHVGTTDSLGKYRIGPLHSDIDYTLSASKEGYIITEERPHHFKAFKLAKITTEVVDRSGSPLNGVLLSLSGGINYRSNRITPENGSLSFVDLSPGQFFMKPMMKEYTFEPPSQMIEVVEGSSVQLKILAVQVAYSCYGYVLSLNGEPEPGVLLEAVGQENCAMYQEEGTSESNGHYRIRGLRPDCTYHLRLKKSKENAHIQRATPQYRVLANINEDLHDVNMIVFHPFTQMDVAVHIIAKQEYWTSLKVLVFREQDLDNPVHTLQVTKINFFYLPPLQIDSSVYLVRLDSELQKNLYEYTLPEQTFKANSTYKHISLKFNPKTRKVDQDISAHGSYMTLLIAVILVIVGFNYIKIGPFVSQLGSTVGDYVRAPSPAATDSPTHSSSESAASATVKRRVRKT